MIVCSFSHTYSIQIRETSNIIQAGTTIIPGQQASISLQGLHNSMESNKLTKTLKRNVNITNYEYPTKPITHVYSPNILFKKIQKMLFLRQYHKTQPLLFTSCIFNDWIIILFICSSLIFIPLSFQVCLACFLFDVFVCIYVYIFILTGLFFCYFTFYLVHFQLSLFALLFIFYLLISLVWKCPLSIFVCFLFQVFFFLLF